MYFYVLSTTDCTTSKQGDSAKRGKKKEDDGKKSVKENIRKWQIRGEEVQNNHKNLNIQTTTYLILLSFSLLACLFVGVLKIF